MWEDQAKKLRIGQKRKIKHCGSDPSAYISNNIKGLGLYCFRCGQKEFIPHDKLSAPEIMDMRRKDEKQKSLPYPNVVDLNDAPSEAHLWLLKAGLTPEKASEKYLFGWSEETRRVIIPILHNSNRTAGWLGRDVVGRKPKYLLSKGACNEAWFQLRSGEECVVVEDVLSAIKIYEAGFNTMAVLGTHISLYQAELLSAYDVIGWFDNDHAGTKGFINLRKALAPFGVSPKRIETRLDPKLYNKTDVKTKVEKSIGVIR